MRESPNGKGLKRQVSPVWASVFILSIIATTVLVGLIWPLSRGRVELNPSQKWALEYQDWRSTINQRLGASVIMRRNSKTDVVVLRSPTRDPKNLQKGDVITAINGRDITTIKDLAARVEHIPSGKMVEVDVQRGDSSLTLQIVTRDQPHLQPSNNQPLSTE